MTATSLASGAAMSILQQVRGPGIVGTFESYHSTRTDNTQYFPAPGTTAAPIPSMTG